MKPADLETLIAHRLHKSEEALQAAKIMLDRQMYFFSMNRVYYSLYYAVQALLAQQGAAFAKHGQVKGYFNREFIKLWLTRTAGNGLWAQGWSFRIPYLSPRCPLGY